MLNLALLAGLIVATVAMATGCAPAGGTAAAGDTTSTLTTIGFLVAIFAVFYFLTIRPQRKRQKQHTTLIQQLQKGDRVVTIGGMYGEIESIDESSVVLKVESGASLRFARDAIAGKKE